MFAAREFANAQSLSAFVNAANGATTHVAVVSVIASPSGSLLLFSNDTDDLGHTGFVNDGPGRGLAVTFDDKGTEQAVVGPGVETVAEPTPAAATAAPSTAPAAANVVTTP